MHTYVCTPLSLMYLCSHRAWEEPERNLFAGATEDEGERNAAGMIILYVGT